MTFYGNLSDTSARLINDKGRAVTLRRGSSTYVPSSDTFTGASSQNLSAKAVFTSYRQFEIDGEIIKREDKKVLMSSDVVPMKGYILVDGSDEYEVLSVEEIKPGDTALIYKVQARK